MITISLTPVPSPRMTRSDKWDPRPCVTRYFAFRNEFRMKCSVLGYKQLQNKLQVDFVLPMPETWSEKKKKSLDGKPHVQTPDLDNLLKSVMDAFNVNDGLVWDIHARKFWGREGEVIIY